MNRIGSALIIVTVAAATPALAVGVRIDPDGASSAASISAQQFVAQVMGYAKSDLGSQVDPNG